jgi:iron complex transport system substrate-binding protein
MELRAAVVALAALVLLAGPAVGGVVGDAGPARAGGESSVQENRADCSFPFERVDATGTTVRVEAEPERVVTLNPSAAQTMWEIGTRGKVVGVTRHAMNLEGAADRTNVSGAGRTINPEEVVGLSPDLVLAPNTVGNETVEQLRNTGLTVYRYREAGDVADVYRKTNVTGRLVGACEGAEVTVAWMQERLSVVEEATRDVEPVPALYVFYGYTAGEGTFIDGIITAAGAENVAAEAGVTGYRQVNEEVVVDRRVEWIVLNSDSRTLPDSPAFEETVALQRNRTVVVEINHLNRPAPRIVHAVSTLAETFHPEAYAAANATATPTPSPTATPPSDPTSSPTRTTTPSVPADSSTPTDPPTSTRTASSTPTEGEPTTTDADGSGPGVVTALVAGLLALGLAGWRR